MGLSATLPIGTLAIRPTVTRAAPIVHIIAVAGIIIVVVPAAIAITGRAIAGGTVPGIVISPAAIIADTDIHAAIGAIGRAA
jgi:hypothetical protein